MQYRDWTSGVAELRSPAWILAYATVDVELAQVLRNAVARYPNVPIFGCTSFQGVFSPSGFSRGVHALGADAAHGVRAAAAFRACGAARAQAEARAAASELGKALGGTPDTILMHATPGFEERVLEGIEEAFEGKVPPVYGGSAADDEIRGDWRVFCGTSITHEGFVLGGFASKRRIHGSFISGYAPTNTHGTVTAAQGRVVESIDDKPAASVYNDWTHGSIEAQLAGGVVLGATTLRPLGRVIDRVGAVRRYLLAHPHQVLPNGALSMFTEVKVGDELVLMLGTESALLERTNQVATRALASASRDESLAGGVLVYCGGCVGAIGAKAADVAVMFGNQVRGAPFIGAATFGEQGCFLGPPKSVNRHGNLMCNAILFEA